MRLRGKLSELLEKGDIFYKALYCYDSTDEVELISYNDSRDGIIKDIKDYIDDIEDMEGDYIFVYKKEYISKKDGAKTLKSYTFEYGRLELYTDYTKEAK